VTKRYRQFTSTEIDEIWRQRGDGRTYDQIGAALEARPSAVANVVVRAGGLRPRRPTPSSERFLSLGEREEISRGLAAGQSCRAIARRLDRRPSTITREVARNGGPNKYRAAEAERACRRRRRRPKARKLARNPKLAGLVEDKLSEKWAPEQISRWLADEYPDDPELRVSHETIYLSLFVQGKGSLRKELHRYLRSGRAIRRPKRPSNHKGKSPIPDKVMISERPAEVADRAVPGHWEGDLLLGQKSQAIATLVERKTRYVMLAHLPRGYSAPEVRDALTELVVRLPEELRRSLTWDQGGEMAHHVAFSVATGVPVYFCEPASPWQRGTNENTNGLLRQYFPKGVDFKKFTQADLDAAARQLNGRPRKTLGWKNPAEAFAEAVAAIP
jgi:transposase, IS30 family